MSQSQKLKTIAFLKKAEHSPKKARIERKQCPSSPTIPVLSDLTLSTPSKKKSEKQLVTEKLEETPTRKEILIALRNQTAQLLASLDQLLKLEENNTQQ